MNGPHDSERYGGPFGAGYLVLDAFARPPDERDMREVAASGTAELRVYLAAGAEQGRRMRAMTKAAGDRTLPLLHDRGLDDHAPDLLRALEGASGRIAGSDEIDERLAPSSALVDQANAFRDRWIERLLAAVEDPTTTVEELRDLLRAMALDSGAWTSEADALAWADHAARSAIGT